MARARNIKPAFFNNDLLAEIDPIGRLLFIGLWTIADFKGDIEWREKRIKAQVLPYDNCDVKDIAINLDKLGFIRFYSDSDTTYINITNFSKHQNPHKNEREKGSDIPEYTELMRQAVDLKGLTINPDKSRLSQDENGTNRADSLILIPDPLSLIPETLMPESSKETPVKLDYSVLQMTDTQSKDVVRIRRKNKGTALTQLIINQLAKQFFLAAEKGFSFDDSLIEWEVRGWKSFKAEWMKTDTSGNGQFSHTTMQNIETFRNVELD